MYVHIYVIQADNRLKNIVDDNLTHNYNDNNNYQIMRVPTAKNLKN